MTRWTCFGSVIMIVTVLSAQQVVEDPVMKIRSQRASSGEGDLPPVPRGVLEPPPLPAPETHIKDTGRWRASRRARRSRRKSRKRIKKRPVVVKKRSKKNP